MGKSSLIVNMRQKVPIAVVLLFFTGLLGCRVGEDDPVLSLRSRDNRLKGSWRLRQIESEIKVNVFSQGRSPQETIISTSYDGRDIRNRTILNGSVLADTTLGFGYILVLSNRGRLSYTTTLVQQGVGLRSGGEGSWYWLSDDRRKARVNLGEALGFVRILAPQLSNVPMISEFELRELRKDVLRLSLHRRMEQTNLNGDFQEIQVSSEFEFRPN
jgi:hypothetical protein